MVKFSVVISYSEIEEAKKKRRQNGLMEERIREEAARQGIAIPGDLLESVSIVGLSPQSIGMIYEVTHPPEKLVSDSKKPKLRKKRW